MNFYPTNKNGKCTTRCMNSNNSFTYISIRCRIPTPTCISHIEHHIIEVEITDRTKVFTNDSLSVNVFNGNNLHNPIIVDTVSLYLKVCSITTIVYTNIILAIYFHYNIVICIQNTTIIRITICKTHRSAFLH